MKTALLVASVSAALSCAAADYSRMDADVSALPPERRFLREMVLSRAWARTPPSDAARTLLVSFQTDGSMDQSGRNHNGISGIQDHGFILHAVAEGAGKDVAQLRMGMGMRSSLRAGFETDLHGHQRVVIRKNPSLCSASQRDRFYFPMKLIQYLNLRVPQISRIYTISFPREAAIDLK